MARDLWRAGSIQSTSLRSFEARVSPRCEKIWRISIATVPDWRKNQNENHTTNSYLARVPGHFYGRAGFIELLQQYFGGNRSGDGAGGSGDGSRERCAGFPRMDRHARRYGQCRDQGSSDWVSAYAKLQRRLVREKRTVAVRDRSAAIPGGVRSSARPALAGQRPTRAGESTARAVRGSARPGSGESEKGAARRRSLRAAPEAECDHTAGLRQRDAEQSFGARSGGRVEGADRNGESADPGCRSSGGGRKGRRGGGSRQPGVHEARIAD